jgi:hypothetical protein
VGTEEIGLHAVAEQYLDDLDAAVSAPYPLLSAGREPRIMGSKSLLLRTLVAAESAKTAGLGVPSSVSKWRARPNKTANAYTIEISL